MREEIMCRGSVKVGKKAIAFTATCPYDSYNRGGILKFSHGRSKVRLKIDIYQAQDPHTCSRIVENYCNSST